MKVKIELHHLMNISNALIASAMFCTEKRFADYNRYLCEIVDKLIDKELKRSEDYWKRNMALKAKKKQLAKAKKEK